MPKSASDKRHFIVAGVLVAISTVLMDILLKAAMPLPLQASIESLTIDALIGWHLTLIAFLFSLIVVFMLYSIVIFRKREDDDSEGEHFEGNSTLEIVWTVIPLIFVVAFSFYGVNALAQVIRSEPNELEVTAVGFQWSWRFEYPNGIISQELVLPINQRALVTLHSEDVLHSFWVPEMRVKQDLVPGYDTHIRFTPILLGDFKVRCAELCGRSHWSMESPVRIVEQAEYDQWVTEQLAAQNPAVVQADSSQQ
ncbi:MAG: cytochrome c oxidase subunit II [Caldilineaceae bacterium]|nr:cytochrome c oxidase subunit II [Caldilineaceae bacterium]